ncbi:MAG TPA: class I SAM-dependent methyltransferase [Symbiobacteriaceae bacterium]|nr:class I SAM-dependent methyltransferase [Symbiobacteriaceae bacterium]
MRTTDNELRRRIAEVAACADSIQGWLRRAEGACLYETARFRAPSPVVVELGAWKGRSTAWLAFGVKDRGEGHVYAVDHWQGSDEEPHRRLLQSYGDDQLFREFQSNLDRLGLTDHVTPIKLNTMAASRSWPVERPIGLLFIDASHEYGDVKRDFEYWSPLVSPGGFILFHDVRTWPGPTRLVGELPAWYRHAGDVHSIWIAEKIG